MANPVKADDATEAEEEFPSPKSQDLVVR